MWLRNSSPQQAGTAVGRGQAALVLNWPEGDRRDASVTIDGKTVSLSPTGQLVFALPPGQHRVMIRRRGFEPIEYSFALAAGERHQYATDWTRNAIAAALPTSGASGPSSAGGVSTSGLPTIDVSALTMASDSGPRGFGGWNQLLDVAEREAAAKQRDILILFTGSDWSDATRHFASEVASTLKFRTFFTEQIELLVIDLPRTQDGYNQVADNAQNQHLVRRYRIETVPTFVLTDSSGQPYSIEKYDPSIASRFLEYVEESQQRRGERDQLFDAVRQGEPAEQLDAAMRAVEWLDEHDLLGFYDAKIRQWHELAKTHDPANQQGKLEVFFEPLWFAQLREAAEDQPERLARTVEVLKTWSRDRQFTDPDRGARMNLIAAGLLAKLDHAEQALPYIEQGLACQPNDRELREQLESARAILQSANQLSSGSGFVVDESGYLLTNHHVIEGPGRLVVRLPDVAEPVPATVVAKDERADMALLRFQPPGGQSLASLAVSNVAMGRGARVAAFGFPLDDTVGKGLKLTIGVISGLPDQSTEGMLLLDCRVNPGNSGGPLCNASGQVVGMVTAKSANTIGVDSYGMAIPAETVSQFLAAHLPRYSATADAAESELPWDAVDRLVSPAVLAVLKLK